MHEHEECCDGRHDHEMNEQALREQIEQEILSELEEESDPVGSWRDAFEDAYYELQVEAMKEILRKKYKNIIGKGAELMADHLIDEIHDEARRAEAEELVLDKMEALLDEDKKHKK
ncbi:MAG: hypothetical protein PHW69_00080 [Elusimicrobiaceae bacterium]|nr:hypothetical protein [Elusimicrobiaceae bacterium]